MSASLINVLKKVPVPLFGTAATAVQFGAKKAASAPRYAQWGVPLVAGGLWFVWPAVDEEWKQSIGFGSTPAEAAKPEEKKEGEAKPAIVVELSEEAKEKIEKAYVVETVELTDEEKAVMKAVSKGDFTDLEKDWDAFTEKAMIPGDGDDDDDDDDDDDVSTLFFVRSPLSRLLACFDLICCKCFIYISCLHILHKFYSRNLFS